MDFVGSVGVPNDQFPVLRGGNEVPAICGPVHGINLREMAFEGTSGAHENSGKTIDISSLSSHLGNMSLDIDDTRQKVAHSWCRLMHPAWLEFFPSGPLPLCAQRQYALECRPDFETCGGRAGRLRVGCVEKGTRMAATVQRINKAVTRNLRGHDSGTAGREKIKK